MTVEKISNILALSNDVKITSAFELNIRVESCGSYFDTFTKMMVWQYGSNKGFPDNR